MSDHCRYIAITDINRGSEIDDVQSMIRLLLYSNEIEIEGLIACSSCFLKKPNMASNTAILHRLIDGYGAARMNHLCHAGGWPETECLHSIVSDGIPVFGQGEGNGFAESGWEDNAGVQAILSSLQRDDPRPLWLGLLGGANTLAQTLWTAERMMTTEAFTACQKNSAFIPFPIRIMRGRGSAPDTAIGCSISFRLPAATATALPITTEPRGWASRQIALPTEVKTE